MNFDTRYIFNYIFIAALLLLIVNDHLLKDFFGNFLTGKLSDVAGIIALPFFLSYFFPKYLKANIFVSALLFTLWKLPVSESFIQFYNGFTPILIERVVDYTDLWVLTLLPLVYIAVNSATNFRIQKLKMGRIPQIGLIIVSIVSFMATSPPRSHYFTESSGNIRLNWSKKVSGNSNDIIKKLAYEGLMARKDSLLIMQLENFTSEEYQKKKENFQYYILDSIDVKGETLRSIQFSFYAEKEDKLKLYLNAMTLENPPEDRETFKEVQETYRKKLREVFKKALK